MTSRANRIILIVLLAGLQQVSSAQGKTPAASWLFPGELTPHIYVDLTYIRQWDRYSGDLNLFFMTSTWQL